MRVVIAGRCPHKQIIEEILSSQGIECFDAPDPGQAKVLSRECPVILLSETTIDPFLSDDNYAAHTISRLGAGEPAVFLLDHGSDTPDYILALVLRRAASLARAKRPAVILARSVRSGLPGVERLYFDARNAGVSIIKYDEISCDWIDSVCEIIVNDGVYRYTFQTPLLIRCAEKEDNEAIEYAEALRLHIYGNNLVNADRWFLSPGRTSRRGVFYIDTGLIYSGSLRDTVISIANEIKRTSGSEPESYAHIDSQKCAYCYTCFRVCPHAALEPDQSAAAMKVIPSSCTGCGICAAVCPAKAIELRGIEPGSLQRESTGGAIAFCCENSAAIAASTAFKDMDINIVSIPCGGNLDSERIAAALKNYSHVLVAVCADEACRHFDGSVRARKQVDKIKRAVEKLGIVPERISLVQVSHAMPAVLREAAGNYVPAKW